MTPFITGLDHTLFSTDSILSAGISGIFMRANTFFTFDNDKRFSLLQQQDEKNIEIYHPDLAYVSDWMTITSCRGNIILTLDDASAARSLLSAINASRSNDSTQYKEDETSLYLEVQFNSNDTQDAHTLSNSSPLYSMPASLDNKVYRITSGDPSKGTLAVDTLKDLQNGMKVRVFVSFYERE